LSSENDSTHKVVYTAGVDSLFSQAKWAYSRRGLKYVAGAGIKMAMEVPSNLFWFWYYRKFKATESFEFQGKRYHYLIHRYNTTWKNERSVSIPIIWDIVEQYHKEGKSILELGNVLSYVFPVHHDILDKYEKARNIINQDIVDYTPRKRYDLIVSVLCLPCVGWDETPRDPGKIIRALANMKNLLRHGGRIVVALGLGYNSNLDSYLRKGKIRFDIQHYMKKISHYEWREVSWEEVKDSKYDYSIPTANGLLIGINEK
jgi:SAM-dependent methyltransferase